MSLSSLPERTDVPWLMKELTTLCLKMKPTQALIISGLFHFHFESIHPFFDGNGRLGRLWSSQILFKSGFSFVEFAALEKYHELHRKKYYETLHHLQGDLFYNISEKLDLTVWLVNKLKK